MEFGPQNPIAKLCLAGMKMESSGHPDEAYRFFNQAWEVASSKLDKFIAAHFLARSVIASREKLDWLTTAMQLALEINDDSVASALPILYRTMAECSSGLGRDADAKKYLELSQSVGSKPTSCGPFFHGTRADLHSGDLLVPGGISNYQSGLKMNHIYFTGLVSGASLAASMAKGDQPERVYIIEPTGPFENDPNVTNAKFPGNPTLSYRSGLPLKIVGEAADGSKLSAAELEEWRTRLAKSKGEIIN